MPAPRAVITKIKTYARRYAKGEAITTLAREEDVSPNTMRRALVDAGQTIRPRGK